MRQIYALLIAFTLGVTSTPASADDGIYVYQPVNVPPCKMYKTSAGVDVCGYENLEDWKKVLVVDLELAHVRNQLANELERSASLADIHALMQTQADAMAANRSILETHVEKLTNDLISLDAKYQKERVKPQWGSPIAWTIAAASTAVLAGVLIAGALH